MKKHNHNKTKQTNNNHNDKHETIRNLPKKPTYKLIHKSEKNLPDKTNVKIHEYQNQDGYHVIEKNFDNPETGFKGFEKKMTKEVNNEGSSYFETSYVSSKNWNPKIEKKLHEQNKEKVKNVLTDISNIFRGMF